MFDSPAEVNYRAIRDMGLAAWWGGSLAGLAGLAPASQSLPSPRQQYEVLDTAMRGARGLMAGSALAYTVGTSLVHFDGKPLNSYGMPRWITEGVESPARTAVFVAALASAIASSKMRAKGMDLVQSGSAEDDRKAEKLRKKMGLVNAAVPALIGALLYSYIKEDMQNT